MNKYLIQRFKRTKSLSNIPDRQMPNCIEFPFNCFRKISQCNHIINDDEIQHHYFAYEDKTFRTFFATEIPTAIHWSENQPLKCAEYDKKLSFNAYYSLRHNTF